MRKLKILVIGLFISLFINGCSDADIVKDGTLNFDNSITVGQAFDKYSYFTSTSWKDFETSNGRKIVEVTGDFNNEYIKLMGWTKQFSEASLTVQFKINKDNTFEVSAIGFTVVGMNGETKEVDVGSEISILQFNNMLKELYNDKPLS